MSPKSELAWQLADYQRHNFEPPERILAQPTACEGQLMTAAEVDQFLKDSIATLMIMLDKGSPRAPQIRATFRADLDCLLSLGKLDQAEYNEITNSQELKA